LRRRTFAVFRGMLSCADAVEPCSDPRPSSRAGCEPGQRLDPAGAFVHLA
jgi:hypothetical protein